MARCDYCGTTILFGGVKDDDLRFCNDNCHQQGILLAVTDQVPEDVISHQVMEVHQGLCPQCGGPGPIDAHTSYTVWSALVITRWQSNLRVCCHSCGIKSKIRATVVSGLLGWWGFPWGLIITPIQLLRNILGLFSSPDPRVPSMQLENSVKFDIAVQIVEAEQDQEADA